MAIQAGRTACWASSQAAPYFFFIASTIRPAEMDVSVSVLCSEPSTEGSSRIFRTIGRLTSLASRSITKPCTFAKPRSVKPFRFRSSKIILAKSTTLILFQSPCLPL